MGLNSIMKIFMPKDKVFYTLFEEVAQTVAKMGKTMKEVAAALDISTRTAEAHKYQIMHDLGVNSVAQLVQFAIQQGLITLPSSSATNSARARVR